MPPQLTPPPPLAPAPAAQQGRAGSGGRDGPGNTEDTSGVEVSNWADPSCRVRRQCRPRLVGLVGCAGVALADVALADSAFWTLHVRRSRHVTLSGLRVSGNRRFPNNDGIDIDGSAHVTITNCTVSTADDAVCLKTTLGQGERDPDPGLRALEAAAAKAAKAAKAGAGCGSRDGGGAAGGAACAGAPPPLPPPRATEHVLVEDCVLRSRSAAVKLGSESRAGMANITFRRVQVLDSNRGLGIQLRDWGDIRDVVFEDVAVATSRVTAGRWWGGGEPIYVTALPRHVDAWGRVGQLRNVTFRRVAATATGGLVVVAGSPESVVRGVKLQDVTLRVLPPPAHPPPAALAIPTWPTIATPARGGGAAASAAAHGPRRRAEEGTVVGVGYGRAAALLLRQAGAHATAPATAGRSRLLGAGEAGAGPGHTPSGAVAGGHTTGAESPAAGGSAGLLAGGAQEEPPRAVDEDWPLGVKLDLRPGPYDVRRWPLPEAGPLLAQHVQGLTLVNVDIQLVPPAPGRTGNAAAGAGGGDGGGEEGEAPPPWETPPPPRSWLAGWWDWWLARPPPWCVELVERTVHGLRAHGVRVRVISADEASVPLPVPSGGDGGGGASGRGHDPTAGVSSSGLTGRGTAVGALWLGVAAVMLCVVAVTACAGAALLQWPRRGQAGRLLLPLPTVDSNDGYSLASRGDGRGVMDGGSSSSRSEDVVLASVWATAAAASVAPPAPGTAPSGAPLPPLPPTGLRSLCVERSRALGSSESLSKKTVATLRTWSPKVNPPEAHSTEAL